MFSQLNSRGRFRQSHRRTNLNLRRLFESLESRQVMAGNITATVDATGNLNVSGDENINGIYVTQVGQGKFLITGLEAGGSATTVNGSTQSITLSGVTGSITVQSGDRDDLIQFDYFNHAGNLRIDASNGHDIINIGTDNKPSFLSGNLVLGYVNSYVVNMLKVNVVGTLSTTYSGISTFTTNTTTTNSNDNLFQRLAAENPNANSYAITSCTFSSDVSLGGEGALQVFIESSNTNGQLSIGNGSRGYSWNNYGPPSITAKPSFVVLNNVSTKNGLNVNLFSSTSFVMNNCTIGQPVLPGDTAATARINLLGTRNIYQLSNSVFNANLQITNYHFNQNSLWPINPIGIPIVPLDPIIPVNSVIFDPVSSPPLISGYDVIQLNNLTCEANVSIISSGNISVKNSAFESLKINVKNLVKLDHVTAADALIYLSSSTRRTSASVLSSTFDNLTVVADVRSRFDYNVSIIDSTVSEILDISGRGGRQNGLTPTVVDAELVFSSANANILIDRSQIGTLYYSYRVDTPTLVDITPKDPNNFIVYLGGLPSRTESEIYQGIYGGIGKDSLTIKNSTFDKFFAQLGSGDDSISFEKSKILTTGHVDGSLGTDKLTRDNDVSVSKAGFINFESTTTPPVGGTVSGSGNSVKSGGSTMTISSGSLSLSGSSSTISTVGVIDFNAPSVSGGPSTISGTGNNSTGGTLTVGSGVFNVGNPNGTLSLSGKVALLGPGALLGNGTGVVHVSTTADGPMNGMSSEEALTYLKSNYTLTVGQKVVINGQEFTVE